MDPRGYSGKCGKNRHQIDVIHSNHQIFISESSSDFFTDNPGWLRVVGKIKSNEFNNYLDSSGPRVLVVDTILIESIRAFQLLGVTCVARW